MLTAVCCFLGVYLVLLVVFMAGWFRVMTARREKATETHFMSVVVAARNEEKNIPILLQALARQRYSAFEVLVVNDQSTDGTRAVVAKFAIPKLTLLDNAGEGKKQALATGIARARGSVIVTTDADCQPPETWLQSINEKFDHPHVKLVAGSVRIAATGFFSTLQAMELASLVGSTAAAIGWRQPIMCNGASLAFRKETFEAVQGYDGNFHIPSGDDEFLMRKIHGRYPGAVAFLNQPGTAVTTTPQPRPGLFFQQRLRWAGKWKVNSSWVSRLLAVGVVGVQLATVVAWIYLVPGSHTGLAILLAAKVLGEAIFIALVSRFVGSTWSLPAFVVLQIVYPFYVIFVGVLSNFSGYLWKGRYHR